MNPTKKKIPFAGILIVFLFLGVIVFNLCSVVTYEDEYSLVKQFGKVESVRTSSGLSFKLPFIQTVDKLPSNILIYDLPISDVITKDKKTMVVDSFVLWKISDPVKFVKTLNSQITNAENRINTTVYNSLKNVIGSLSQSDVISGRNGELVASIMENIGDSMDQYGIELIAVETKHLDLPDDNKQAVYERMISERNNIAATYTAEGESEAQIIKNTTNKEIDISISKAEAEAESIIAEGEAEYMKILADAYSTKERSDFYNFIRSLDAAKASLTGSNKTLILSSDSPIAQIFNSID